MAILLRLITEPTAVESLVRDRQPWASVWLTRQPAPSKDPSRPLPAKADQDEGTPRPMVVDQAEQEPG